MREIVLGLTGPSGAGKTVLSEYLASLGFHVLNADEIYHSTIKKGTPCFSALVAHFGSGIVGPDGEIDRKKLGGIVFGDKRELLALEKITHPYVVGDIAGEIEKFRQPGKNIVLDAPTLFESGADKLCDKTIAITADYKVRLQRIMRRDNLSMEKAKARLDSQKDDNYYVTRADFTVKSNGGFAQVRAQVDRILEQLQREFPR